MKSHEQLDNIKDQFLKGKAGELNDLTIPATDAMRERLDVFAKEMDVTTEECAGFLLWSYLIDVEAKANAVKENIMPRN